MAGGWLPEESQMPRELTLALIDATTAVIAAHADELTRLDQAIGDGDHGSNMARGFAAISAQRDALAELELGDALQKAGMTLVTTVGGASGPLYGSLLMGIGKGLKVGKEPVEAFAEGVESVRKRGKSDVGAKTMLDVLVPALEALRASPDGLAKLRAAAISSRDATIPMQATRGRASFLGERSIGHLDPGATSSCLLIQAVNDVLDAGK
jgi:phosphoenolpyruvate---glycerone phosphotransferase subunit DhaL